MRMETHMNLGFRIIRLLEDSLTASDCALTVHIEISPEHDPATVKDRIRAMKIWTENYLDECVAFGVGTEVDTRTLEVISNNIMMCPDDPHDYLLLALIHSKLSALGGDDVQVLKSSLVTDTSEGFGNSIEGDSGEWLPNMDEWLGPKKFHAYPWWSRADSSTIDLKPEDGDDTTQAPQLGLSIEEMVSKNKITTEETPIRKEAEIIKPSFKPRIITPDD